VCLSFFSLPPLSPDAGAMVQDCWCWLRALFFLLFFLSAWRCRKVSSVFTVRGNRLPSFPSLPSRQSGQLEFPERTFLFFSFPLTYISGDDNLAKGPTPNDLYKLSNFFFPVFLGSRKTPFEPSFYPFSVPNSPLPFFPERERNRTNYFPMLRD